MPGAERPDRHSGERQSFTAAFSRALLDPEDETPGVVTGPGKKAAVRRYNVHRNNVTVSLIKALAEIFPATQRLTGPEFFRAMARSYIRSTPPTSPLLFEYGHDFPDFIAHYKYAQSMHWLPDTARIERAWLDAYHAADASPLTAADLASIPPDHLANIVFVPHPATRVVRSQFSALTIFAANRGGETSGPIRADEPEDTLITRPELEVFARRLPRGGAIFLSCLMSGDTFGEATFVALESDASFDLPVNLAGLIQAGAFTKVVPKP
jgi:hypothetical protein